MTTPSPSAARQGVLLGATAYLLWGAMPLFFPLLEPAGAFEIIAHRIVWSLVFCVVLLVATRTTSQVAPVLRDRRLLGRLAVGAVLVAVNWTVYVWGVLHGHVLDAALGYFINPLVTIGLAVVVLRERLRPAQWVALGFGGVAVVVLTVGVGTFPWIAMSVAVSFGLYALVKNRTGAHVAALPALAVETGVLAPLALAFLAVLAATGSGTFTTEGVGHALLLASCGVVTGLPLLLFGAAARRVPLRVVGMLQYLAPVLQFLVGLLVLHEPMPTARWVGFALVWVALVILTADALRAVQGARLARRTTVGPEAAGTSRPAHPNPPEGDSHG
ncbi:chloramphenicol-sensitive protein RarD [Sediminihabitans luteus]|uniref:Chloramphenicol-sensitive protein RarD n=1 Tax=Sediminihabitans luteus TaxID=1138585 RepID=A0A2M9CZH7_9CELL|nr:EamA family transporter RarD [Sediminihabitans luteus]PJJ77297.1 chloramphenicol-sensitive protein RarD [Sediminihabitans luteus]GII98748.1 protein RarD [Sediminihabitans luteus]